MQLFYCSPKLDYYCQFHIAEMSKRITRWCASQKLSFSPLWGEAPETTGVCVGRGGGGEAQGRGKDTQGPSSGTPRLTSASDFWGQGPRAPASGSEEVSQSDSLAGPAGFRHLIAGPVLRSSLSPPFSPRRKPWWTLGCLLMEAEQCGDALVLVPQPQGHQVPIDHLDLAVQPHLLELRPAAAN